MLPQPFEQPSESTLRNLELRADLTGSQFASIIAVEEQEDDGPFQPAILFTWRSGRLLLHVASVNGEQAAGPALEIP